MLEAAACWVHTVRCSCPLNGYVIERAVPGPHFAEGHDLSLFALKGCKQHTVSRPQLFRHLPVCVPETSDRNWWRQPSTCEDGVELICRRRLKFPELQNLSCAGLARAA